MSTPILRATCIVLIATTFAGSTAGLHLTFLTETTETTFAWHIRNPMTAAFFGAAYISAGIALSATLLRARRWEELRAATILTAVFMSVAGIATIVHIDEFQYDSPHQAASFVTWVWLLLYFGLPVGLVASVIRQERIAGPDTYTAEQPLLPPFRLFFLLAGTVVAAYGIGLLLAAEPFIDAWPWPLPTLSARVVGAWVLATGLTQLWSVREDDWLKLETYAIATLAFYPLQATALLRYHDRLEEGPQAYVYIAALATLFLAQTAACVVHARLARAAHPSAALQEPG